MSKNIVIFSDGTGQRGGLLLDENRSNIYKLYRACKVASDTSIDPNRQIAYYDPGIGTMPPGMGFMGSVGHKVYNIVSQALGLGLTRNIMNCYGAILKHWEPGDRIFLFGFSRGAYTVRCLAAVLAKCGVPDFKNCGLPKSPAGIREAARAAVKGVYQFTSSWVRSQTSADNVALLDMRDEMALHFRKTHGAADAFPHFIGVFDTVASLANPSAAIAMIAGLAAIIMFCVSIVYFVLPQLALPIGLIALSITCAAAALYVASLIRYWSKDQGGPGFLRSAHITELRMNFYDRTLNKNVGFARHAISIDEQRKSFDRVRWGDPKEWKETKPIWFDQTWFAGNHSNIGGSYPDNDSGLSDHALAWMVDSAERVGLLVDRSHLSLYPRHDCMQHDEMKSSAIFKRAGRTVRKMPSDAILHGSVLDRFEENSILNFDTYERYRPTTLSSHKGVFQHYIADALLDGPDDPQAALQWVRNDVKSAQLRSDHWTTYAWQKVEHQLLRRLANVDGRDGETNTDSNPKNA